MARAIEPTDQLLREACARMSQRFRWNDSFEVVMQDASRSRLVRIAVSHPTAASAPFSRAACPAPAPTARPPLGGLPLFDRKRAASGEREDD